ncbi:UDP-4-amino-4,6-dideoxy-N-acetyl-beta-L-altrosamine N-acetyltransferase [Brevundimonas sp.]|uniref:UDP-4-amino-4, 6-dideoxy-N-acetyl-beta-L-altrosamine N-acetyltransferase n=1 Tax=Brevundimonas sp. TaxID=1871086 RepID=UPI0035AF75FA
MADGLREADCRLRPIEAGDRERILGWRNQDRVRAAMYTDHVISEDEHGRWFARALEAADDAYLIFEHQGRPMGFVSITRVNREHDRAEWAFYLGEAEAPRGMGGAMEMLALDHAFGAVGVSKLCCEVLGFNAGVVRMHRRFGFVEEGLLKRHFRRGEDWHDVVLLARFSEGWAGDRAALRPQVFAGDGA